MRVRIGGLVFILLLAAAGLTAAQVPGEPTKGDDTPAGPGSGLPEATGGPDAFGYVFFDQAEPECTYDFVDISATGMQIVDGDDTSSGAVAFGGGASFDFYGVVQTAMNMAANGYLTTDGTDTGPDLSNDCPIPATPSTGGGGRIYPLHDDLDLEAGIGRGLYEYFDPCPRPNDRCAPEDCSVYMWDDVAHFPGGAGAATWDMEVILYHQTNDIVFLIEPGNPEAGSGSTTGIQDYPPPTIALQYACDTAASVPDSTAVCIQHPNAVPGICAGGGAADLGIPTLNRTGIVVLVLVLAVAGVILVRRLF